MTRAGWGGPASTEFHRALRRRVRSVCVAPFQHDDLAVLDGQREPAVLELQRAGAEQLAPPAARRGHVGRSLAAMASRSSTVAIILAATPLSSLACRSSTLSSSTVAAPCRHAPLALDLRQGLRDRARSRVRSPPGSPRRRAIAPCRAERRADCQGPRRCAARRGDFDQHVVLQHPRARDVARLRLRFAPGGNLHQHRQIARFAGAAT